MESFSFWIALCHEGGRFVIAASGRDAAAVRKTGRERMPGASMEVFDIAAGASKVAREIEAWLVSEGLSQPDAAEIIRELGKVMKEQMFPMIRKESPC